jgi:PTS system nitrogen regulatory IIA component
MQMSELLASSAVISELSSPDAVGVLHELSAQPAPPGQESVFLSGLRAREGLGSTALGDGFSLPHARIEGLERLIASFGRSSGGVAFGSPDGKPTFLFFALFSPVKPAGAHLKALARISQLFRQPALREGLLSARSATALYQLLLAADAVLGVTP